MSASSWQGHGGHGPVAFEPVRDAACEPGLSEIEIEPYHEPIPTSVKIALLLLFLPQEASFFVFGLRLTPERVVLLALTPVVFVEIVKKWSAGHYRFVASDIFVIMAGLWMFIGPSVTFSFGDALSHSGPDALEYVIGYMMPRVLLSSRGQSVTLVGWLCLLIALVAVDALLDPLFGRYVTRELFAQISGYSMIALNEDSFRYGLLRASGTLEHPILFGFASGVGLLLAVAIRIRFRWFCIAACGMGVVLSISSAPQMSAVIGLMLLLYSRIMSRVRMKWVLIGIIPSLTFIILYFSTSTPFGHILSIMTINPLTAYYRLYIWQMVGPGILNYPWFSVPHGSYDYQGSVDSVWLVLALSYGIPGSVLAGLSLLGACSLPVSSDGTYWGDAEAKLGAALGIIIFLVIFMGFTVDFWGPVWIMVGILMGLRAHLGEMANLPAQQDYPPVSAPFSSEAAR